MLENYLKIRETLLKLPAKVAAAAESEESRQALSVIARRLDENEFCLVVAGQFKRGKSTFINALLGDDLLPTAIIPVTSIITEIRYGESLRINVIFNDGTKEEISSEDLARYVTEKNNPRNTKDVKIVEIFHPSFYLKNNIRLIDTPGVASIHSHNTDVTYSYLPNADAAIFLVSVDPPITDAEYHFLNDLRGFATRLFFIQNKIDTVSAADRIESLEFTREVIGKQAGLEDITIFPLSAKKALEGKLDGNRAMYEESGLVAFEAMLENFLIEEKGRVLLASAASKIRNIVAQESFSARLMQKSLGEPLKDLEDKIGRFAATEQEIAQERQDSHHLARAEAGAMATDVLIPDLDALKAEKTSALVKAIDEYYESIQPIGKRDLVRDINQFVHERIHDAFDEFQSREEGILRTRLEAILERLISRTNRIIKNIVSVSASIFEIDLQPFTIEESLAKESAFTFKIEEDVKVSLEYITESATLLLPRPLAHKIILRNARERMKELIERHCGRLRQDFMARIEKSVTDFEKQLNETVEASLGGIRRALDVAERVKQEGEHGASEKEADLGQRLRILESALHELDGLKEEKILASHGEASRE